MHRRFALWILFLFASAAAAVQEPWPPPYAGAREVPLRKPLYPLKNKRILVSDSEIAVARANLQQYPPARAVLDGIRKTADPWLEWDDADIQRLITPASVPRAFDVSSSAGCPKCGKEIHEKFGTYPWIVDLRKPFKLTCPVDGSVYPTNDYAAYLRSGFKEKRGWDTPYVDDGWGWLSPSGERYWWVAHYNHRVWHEHLGPGVLALARAYLLTGEARYAHKAAWMLANMATVYPAMDHEKQSRYGLMQAARGERYPGKVINHIWETNLAAGFAEAYDLVWETIDGDSDLQKRAGKDGASIRAHIEANLLEEAIDSYFNEKIRGNFGMHQVALANLALARQFGDTDKWLGGLLDRSDGSDLHIGLRFALYNNVFRDGLPYETAPGYNFLWVSKIADLATLLQKSGRDLFAIPRLRLLFEGPLDIINTGKFTPSLGDSGSVYGGLVGADSNAYQTAFRQYRNERFARFLAQIQASGDRGFRSYESLFLKPVEASNAEMPPQQSRVLDGYGMGILSNPSDTISLSLYYGLKGGHGHFDRLGFELFAAGQPIMPDLGYPDAMNAYVPGIYTWSKNTISHNTVTVDAARQPENAAGSVQLFASSPFARVIDVDGGGTYPGVQRYRRAIIMVDTGKPDQSYFVDVFDVSGGKQHDYSLHGPPGEFLIQSGNWSDPAPGTLAGENVPLGQIYDAPEMAAPGYKGGYATYRGSGFQHFTNVRRHNQGECVAEWRHEKDKNARLRIRILPAENQQIFLAEARVSPVKQPQTLRYLIVRSRGENLASRFVSVLQPYRTEPFIESVARIPLTGGSGVCVQVRRSSGNTDWIFYDPDSKRKRIQNPVIETDAHAAVVTTAAGGAVERVFFAGGSFLNAARQACRAAAIRGKVTGVDPARSQITIALEGSARVDEESLRGRLAHFRSPIRMTAHPIDSARKKRSVLTLTTRDDLLIGKGRAKSVSGSSLVAENPFPLAPVYTGAYATDAEFKSFRPIRNAAGSTITLASQADAVSPGEDFWIVNVAPGDRLELPALFSWSKPPD